MTNIKLLQRNYVFYWIYLGALIAFYDNLGLVGADCIVGDYIYCFIPCLVRLNINDNNGSNEDFKDCINPYDSFYPYNPLITKEIEEKLKWFRDNPTKGRGNSNVIKQYNQNLPPLSDYQIQALIGLLLGDASIQAIMNAKGEITGYRIKFDYSKNKHHSYAVHVSEVLRHWVLTHPTDQGRKDSDYVATRFQTIKHPAFDRFGEMFLQSGKKSVPENLIKDYVTPVTLAYWFSDDGGKTDYSGKSSGIEFHTGGFDDASVELMAQQVQDKFGIKCWKAYNRNYPIIRVGSPSYPVVEKLIKPYIIPEMHFKLPGNKK